MKILGLGMALSLVSNVLIAIAPARALPDSQIIEKLQGIPVFTLTDQSGSPLTATDAKKNNFTGGYLSRKEAQAFLQNLQKKDPALAKQLQIRAVRLSELYNAQYNTPADKKLEISYVGSQPQVDAALAILQKKDRKIKSFNGVPLFVGRAGNPPGYITVDSNGKKVIPLFFDREQLQPFVDKFKKERPDLAATAEIQVITLEGLIASLRTKSSDSRADSLYSQILLYPSREAIEYIRSNNNNTPQTSPSAKPTTTNPVKPPKKTK
jgi:hypothetical protein